MQKRHRHPRNAFTLIELMVVIGIVVILLAVSAPLLKSLSKSNGASSSVNFIRAYLSNARATAIAQHRQVGVVFFEESPTPNYAGSERHGNQTAMQTIIEDANQLQYAPIAGNTVFVYYSTERQYLPAGIALATLNDSTTVTALTGENSGAKCRVILFDSNGQMVLRDGIAHPLLGAASPGTYPYMYGDWHLTTPGSAAANGVSSPGVLTYDKSDYNTQNFPAGAPGDAPRSAWLQNNAQIAIINSYTGAIIRDWGGVTR